MFLYDDLVVMGEGIISDLKRDDFILIKLLFYVYSLWFLN